MWGIIIHHCIVHGLGLKYLSDSYDGILFIEHGDMAMMVLINCLAIPAVNCFILLSGYFGIKTTYAKFANVLFAMFFYTIIMDVIPYAAKGEYKRMIASTFFLSHSPYWFMIDYLFLMLLAPMINKVYESDGNYLKHLTIGLFVISCYFGFIWNSSVNVDGYTLIQFITMYTVGRYISKKDISWNRYKCIIVWILCSGVIAFIMYFCWMRGLNNWAWRMTYYNNPLLIAASICIFQVFKSLRFHSRLVNKMAASALSIYLVQSSRYGESLLYGKINEYYNYNYAGGYNSLSLVIVYIFVVSVAIVIISLLIDQIRLWIYNSTFAKVDSSWPKFQ